MAPGDSWVWLVWGRIDHARGPDSILLSIFDSREVALEFEADTLDHQRKVRGHTYQECWTTPWRVMSE